MQCERDDDWRRLHWATVRAGELGWGHVWQRMGEEAISVWKMRGIVQHAAANAGEQWLEVPRLLPGYLVGSSIHRADTADLDRDQYESNANLWLCLVRPSSLKAQSGRSPPPPLPITIPALPKSKHPARSRTQRAACVCMTQHEYALDMYVWTRTRVNPPSNSASK